MIVQVLLFHSRSHTFQKTGSNHRGPGGMKDMLPFKINYMEGTEGDLMAMSSFEPKYRLHTPKISQ